MDVPTLPHAHDNLQARAAADDEDPLDAFMAAEVLPEVKQRQAQEEARRQEERRKMAEQLASGKGEKGRGGGEGGVAKSREVSGIGWGRAGWGLFSTLA